MSEKENSFLKTKLELLEKIGTEMAEDLCPARSVNANFIGYTISDYIASAIYFEKVWLLVDRKRTDLSKLDDITKTRIGRFDKSRLYLEDADEKVRIIAEGNLRKDLKECNDELDKCTGVEDIMQLGLELRNNGLVKGKPTLIDAHDNLRKYNEKQIRSNIMARTFQQMMLLGDDLVDTLCEDEVLYDSFCNVASRMSKEDLEVVAKSDGIAGQIAKDALENETEMYVPLNDKTYKRVFNICITEYKEIASRNQDASDEESADEKCGDYEIPGEKYKIEHGYEDEDVIETLEKE